MTSVAAFSVDIHRPTRGVRPPRPMLSRDAEALYWMSRYFERAEHTARLLHLTGNLLTDVGDLAYEFQTQQWRSVLEIFGSIDDAAKPAHMGMYVMKRMTLDPQGVNSILQCVSRARENARAVRKDISSEMWESLNSLYLSLLADDAQHRLDEAPEAFFGAVISASLLFQGQADQTLPQDQGWQFVQLGKLLERADVTCSVLVSRYEILTHAESHMDTPLRNIQWMALLRACGALEAYRRLYIGDMDPRQVVDFLLFEPSYPRSVLTNVREAHRAISAIRADTQPLVVDPAQRILGRLLALLEFTDVAELHRDALTPYVRDVKLAVAAASAAVHKRYFLY